MTMIEPQHLKYFYTVAKMKSFTKAAKELRISQPAISKMVANLENQIGKTLFHRINRKPVLTQTGEYFYHFSKELFSKMDQLEDYIKDQSNTSIGTIRLGASDNLINYKLPKIIHRFEKKYPLINFQIYSGTSEAIQDQIKNGSIDFGIFYTLPIENELKLYSIETISEVEFVLVAPKDCSIHKFDIKKLEQELTYVGSRPNDYLKTYPALKMYQKLGLNPKKFIQTNLQEAHKRFVIEGIGWSLLPIHMVEDEMNLKKIKRIITPIKLFNPIYLVCLKNSHLNSISKYFIDHLKNSFKQN